MLLQSLLLTTLLAGQYAPEAEAEAYGGERYPDPALCQVVVDDMGSVGFRIADAQALAERTTSGLRKRLGRDAVIYEGLLKNAKKMKRMLRGSETEIQDQQIAYYEAASKAATHRVRVRFGKKKKQHWVKLTCRKAGRKRPVETRRLTGATFGELRDKLPEAMETFCAPLKPKAPAVVAPPKRPPPKPKEPWRPPPMRKR